MKQHSFYDLFFFIIVFGFSMLMPIAIAPAAQVVEGINPSVPFSHTLWDATLAETVSAEGWIDFSQLKARPRVFNAY